MVPLGHTNKAEYGVRQLPATVLTWQVHCGCFFFVSLSTQWLFLCAHAWMASLALLWLPTRPHPHPPAHPLYTESVISVEFRKKVSQNPAV